VTILLSLSHVLENNLEVNGSEEGGTGLAFPGPTGKEGLVHRGMKLESGFRKGQSGSNSQLTKAVTSNY
jgi:hypothetical protein